VFQTIVATSTPLPHPTQRLPSNIPPNAISRLKYPRARPNKHTLPHIQPSYRLHPPAFDHILNISNIQIQPPIRPAQQLAFGNDTIVVDVFEADPQTTGGCVVWGDGGDDAVGVGARVVSGVDFGEEASLFHCEGEAEVDAGEGQGGD